MALTTEKGTARANVPAPHSNYSPAGQRTKSREFQGRIDFAEVNREALRILGPVLFRLLPGGKVIAGEYVARNPKRADARAGSFKVRFLGVRAGMWSDFATGDAGGDVISLAAYLMNLSQVEAARQIAGIMGVHCG